MTTTDLLANALAFADADKHEGDLRGILNQAKAASMTLAAEVRRLQAIVDELPWTADNVPVCPGDRIWILHRGYPTDVSVWEFSYYESNGQTKRWHAHTVFGVVPMAEAYSTCTAAAEAARSKT